MTQIYSHPMMTEMTILAANHLTLTIPTDLKSSAKSQLFVIQLSLNAQIKAKDALIVKVRSLHLSTTLMREMTLILRLVIPITGLIRSKSLLIHLT